MKLWLKLYETLYDWCKFKLHSLTCFKRFIIHDQLMDFKILSVENTVATRRGESSQEILSESFRFNGKFTIDDPNNYGKEYKENELVKMK